MADRRRNVPETLRDRAATLARRDDDSFVVTFREVATFAVGGHHIGVPSRSLVRAALLDHVTDVPGAPSYVCGLTAVDGHLVALIDLPLLHELGRSGISDIAACVVVQGDGREIGLGAEQLFGLEDVPESAIVNLPAATGALRQAARLPGRDLLLLDVDALFEDPRLGGAAHG